MIAALSSTAVAAVGGAGTDLRNTIVIALIWPCCFFVGAHWRAAGLAASWLVAIPVSFALNFSRIGKVLGLRFLELVRTVGVSFAAGALMYAAVALARYELAGMSVVLRLAGLVLVGAATYLAVVSVLDRSVWADMRRLLAGDRG
jgi:hypothetical protein